MEYAEHQNRILVIEDDPDLMFGICRVLSRCNCDVRGAASVEKAFQILSNIKIDILFSDMRLPGQIGGEQILKLAQERHPGIKVILMSSTMDETRRRELIAKGADECIEKPFYSEKCEEVIASVNGPNRHAA